MSQHGVCLYRSAEDGLTLCPEPLVVWPGSLESAAGTIRALRGFSSVFSEIFGIYANSTSGLGELRLKYFKLKLIEQR